MWILYAFGSALFAGITAVLAKVGIRKTDSHLATALRTVVVLVFAWIMVFAVGSQVSIPSLTGRTVLFLILSGLATGASWLCYFRALQCGEVNQVAPIDKSSTILTMLMAFVFLHEPLTWNRLLGMALLGLGTYLMLQKKKADSYASHRKGKKTWLLYAFGSAVFASLTAILGKVGMEQVESNLGTAIRTAVVLVMAWGIVFIRKKQREIPKIDQRSWLFIGLSGLATGLSWICYYRALQQGPASVVVPIDKLSILVTVAFARVFLKEKLSLKALGGLVLITVGTLLLLLKN